MMTWSDLQYLGLQWQPLDDFLIDSCQEELHVGHSIVMQHVCDLHGTRLVVTHSDVATSAEMRCMLIGMI